MIEELNGLAEKLLRLGEFAAIVGALFAGGYFGARKQQAAAMKPLVGDPPLESRIPLMRQVTDLLKRFDRLEDRQGRTEADVAQLRDEAARLDRDLEDEKTFRRQHDERIGKLETRVFNVENACHLNHRADSAVGAKGTA